jgi:hypothetical protein
MCLCATVAILVPCVSLCGARIGLAGRRIGGSRESRSGRFAWGCLRGISNLTSYCDVCDVENCYEEQLTVQLVAVQMLGPRVALSTALVWTLKLLVEPLPAPPPLPRGALAVTLAIARVAILVPVASTPAVLTAVWGSGGRWFTCTHRSIHLVPKLRLDLAQIRRVRCMH